MGLRYRGRLGGETAGPDDILRRILFVSLSFLLVYTTYPSLSSSSVLLDRVRISKIVVALWSPWIVFYEARVDKAVKVPAERFPRVHDDS